MVIDSAHEQAMLGAAKTGKTLKYKRRRAQGLIPITVAVTWDTRAWLLEAAQQHNMAQGAVVDALVLRRIESARNKAKARE